MNSRKSCLEVLFQSLEKQVALFNEYLVHLHGDFHRNCEGCLVVRTGHGDQEKSRRSLDLSLSWNSEEDIWKVWKKSNGTKEEKETGEENNHNTTHKCTCMDGMTRARQLEPRCDTMCINELRSVCSVLSVVHVHVRDSVYVDHRVVLKVAVDVAIIYTVICS